MFKKLKQILWLLLTTHVAWPVLLTVGLLCLTSIMALQVNDGSGIDVSNLQLRHLMIGTGALLLTLIFHYEWYGRLSYAFLIGTVILLILVFFTEPINYSRRWFSLFGGLQLQPSELAKIAFILTVAWHLRYRRSYRQISGLIAPVIMMLIPSVLILLEPDLGTCLLFPLVLYAILIASGARIRHLIIIAYIALMALPCSYFLLRPYQKERVHAMYIQFLHNDNTNVMKEHRMGSGYQGFMSKVAIASGGATGGGVHGADLVHRGMLYAAHTDFIFAVVGSQWGFIGAAGVILLYLAFLGAGMEIASSNREPFGRLVAIGIVSLITFEAMINIAMTIGIIPVVGIALPFMSYGGSSMVTNMVAVGILLNISVRRKTKVASLSRDFSAA